MTTYGKRKKPLKSTFAVFRDDDEAATSNEKLSHAPRFGRRKNRSSPHQYQTRHDDDSLDELAAAALLKEIPQKPIGHSSLREGSSAHSVPRPASTIDLGVRDGLDKSLPPTPKPSRASVDHDHSKRQPLVAKTTNPKVKAKDWAQSRSAFGEDVQKSMTATGSSLEPVTPVKPKRNDPVALNRKIGKLLQQAAAQEAESRRTEAIYDHEVAKPSPRQRAKKALMKATQAFKHKLSSGSNDNRRPDVIMAHYHAGGSDYVLVPHDESTDDILDKRFSRRKAEGVNLSNPKIQALTGDGTVPRKPLTIYETMRSRTLTSSFLEDDQSADEMHTDSEANTQKCSNRGVQFDSSGHNTRGTASQETSLDSRQSLLNSKISGHQEYAPTRSFVDTTGLSSSPDASSTPAGRLHNRDGRDHDDDRKLPQTYPRHELTVEGPSDEEPWHTPLSLSRFSADRNQSAKKRESLYDPPSPTLPLSKKAKMVSRMPADEAGNVTDAMSGLDTQGDPEPSSKKDPGGTRKTEAGKADRRKGLRIFDVAKGKETEAVEGDKALKQSHPRALMGKKSAFSRPASGLFCFDSRPGNGKFSKLEQDEMDADELS
ncbi:MAG: hypothetical protein OHK93_006609 [Ramalina farinacea]|uniref:Uncharacterized protein n=1 Tax=Ramalina farinacea TaxID=258253 RepID=A0AA43QN58_9LECA|nr:hypothetical protein [Ramalina farinacea]